MVPRAAESGRTARPAPPRRSAGLRTPSPPRFRTCVYTILVLTSRCPNGAWTVRMSYPDSRRWVAKLCAGCGTWSASTPRPSHRHHHRSLHRRGMHVMLPPLPQHTVPIGARRRKTHGHGHSAAARGSFRSRAPGKPPATPQPPGPRLASAAAAAATALAPSSVSIFLVMVVCAPASPLAASAMASTSVGRCPSAVPAVPSHGRRPAGRPSVPVLQNRSTRS